jgi:hypothetical protein
MKMKNNTRITWSISILLLYLKNVAIHSFGFLYLQVLIIWFRIEREFCIFAIDCIHAFLMILGTNKRLFLYATMTGCRYMKGSASPLRQKLKFYMQDFKFSWRFDRIFIYYSHELHPSKIYKHWSVYGMGFVLSGDFKITKCMASGMAVVRTYSHTLQPIKVLSSTSTWGKKKRRE